MKESFDASLSISASDGVSEKPLVAWLISVHSFGKERHFSSELPSACRAFNKTCFKRVDDARSPLHMSDAVAVPSNLINHQLLHRRFTSTLLPSITNLTHFASALGSHSRRFFLHDP